MARLNLLPWREERRKLQQKDFLLAMAGAVCATAAVLLSVHLHIDGLIELQDQRNEFLALEIKKLDKQIEEIKSLDASKRRLIARMEIIQALQSSRPQIVHLFDEIARTVPDGVRITQLAQTGKNLSFHGVAQSNARVSAYMRNIESAVWMSNPRLNVIETTGKSSNARVSNFILKVNKASEKTPDKAGRS